jgi:hypothetical protein
MSSVVINGDTSGAVTLSAPAVAGTVTVTLPATSGTMLTTASSTGISGSAISSGTVAEAYGGTGTTTGYYGFKNRIINGAMVINQRGWSGNITTGNEYTLDRFQGVCSVSSKFSVSQSTSVYPTGFNFSLLATSQSAYTVGAAEQYILKHNIEAYNTNDLAWGTASASAVTLSFRVYSSLTGTFGGALFNSNGSRSYPFTYSIPTANTWTTISITIAGDTSGTWAGTNGVGISVSWGLGVGSTLSGTSGSWSGNYYSSATGAVSVVGTNGATFYITGVQLEKGSTATSFDYRPYGQEFYLCQRYYQTLPFGSGFFSMGGAIATNNVRGTLLKLDTIMRAAPTVTIPASGSGAGQMYFNTASGGTPSTIGTNSVQRAQVDSFQIEGDGYTGAFVIGQGVGLSAGSGGLTITASSEI